MINRTILLAGFTVAGACLGPSAQAQSPALDDSVRQEHVSFSDLDLTGRTGAKILMIRLHRAANDVCGRWDGSIEPLARSAVTTCVGEAMARAVKQVDRPELTALFGHGPAMQLASVAVPRR